MGAFNVFVRVSLVKQFLVTMSTMAFKIFFLGWSTSQYFIALTFSTCVSSLISVAALWASSLLWSSFSSLSSSSWKLSLIIYIWFLKTLLVRSTTFGFLIRGSDASLCLTSLWKPCHINTILDFLSRVLMLL